MLVKVSGWREVTFTRLYKFIHVAVDAWCIISQCLMMSKWGPSQVYCWAIEVPSKRVETQCPSCIYLGQLAWTLQRHDSVTLWLASSPSIDQWKQTGTADQNLLCETPFIFGSFSSSDSDADLSWRLIWSIGLHLNGSQSTREINFSTS